MSWDLFGYLCLQLFISALVTASAFLVCFNVIVALYEQADVVAAALRRVFGN